MKTQVTKPAAPPDERYMSRSGVLQPNVFEAARNADLRTPEHQKAERLIDRTTINDLEITIKGFQDRISDRERSVASLTPQVRAAEQLLESRKEDVKNCAQALAERIPGSRQDAQYAAGRLANAESSLAELKQRLEVSQRVLDCTLAIQLEWHKVNGKRLAHLRKLTHDSNRRSGSFDQY